MMACTVACTVAYTPRSPLTRVYIWPQVDPHLLVLPRLPQLPLAYDPEGGEGGGEGGDEEGGGPSLMERSPRPLPRRRRIASLHFDDGSSCSCSPLCGDGGDGEGCCADVPGARRALCHSASMADLGAEPPRQLDQQDPHEGLEGQAARPPRCPVARPDLASRGGGAPLRLVVSNLASYPVRLLLLDHVGEEQPHKTLLVDQARSPATTHREAPTLHTPCHPPARHLSPPVSPPLPHAQHAEYEALSTHAWRVRTFSGQLLLEVAEVTPPPAESGDVVSVYVRECEWSAQR